MRPTVAIFTSLLLATGAAALSGPGAHADGGATAPPLTYDTDSPSQASVTATRNGGIQPTAATTTTTPRGTAQRRRTAPTLDYDADAPSSTTIVARATPTARHKRIAATDGAISCQITYDYPHASSTATPPKTTINAHLVADCDYNPETISLASQMCHSNLDARGALTTRTSSPYSNYLRVGGDMPCGPLARYYQAFGSVDIVFGPGYTPSNYTDFLASQKRQFQLSANGICVLS